MFERMIMGIDQIFMNSKNSNGRPITLVFCMLNAYMTQFPNLYYVWIINKTLDEEIRVCRDWLNTIENS
jgi:hypothetical protein